MISTKTASRIYTESVFIAETSMKVALETFNFECGLMEAVK